MEQGEQGNGVEERAALPITPAEAAEQKKDSIPPAVIKAFNILIVEKMSGGKAVFTQEEVVKRLVEEKGLSEADIYSKGYLNVEKLYEKAGWQVQYDKPGYNEDYPATFTFLPQAKKE